MLEDIRRNNEWRYSRRRCYSTTEWKTTSTTNKRHFDSSIESQEKEVSQRTFLLGISHHEIITATLSLFASFVSATTLIGLPAAVYRSGIHYFVHSFNVWFVSYFCQLHCHSSLCSARVQDNLRVLGEEVWSQGLCLPLSSCTSPTYSLPLVFGWEFLLESCLNCQDWVSSGTILVTEVVVIFYASFGGMKAIVNAHVIQTVIVLFSSLAVVVKGIVVVGGVWTCHRRKHSCSRERQVLWFWCQSLYREVLLQSPCFSVISSTGLWLTVQINQSCHVFNPHQI